MSYTIASLPPLFDVDPLSPQLSNKLPEFHPLFFVPPLEDRPQNPIVEALVEASSSLPQLAVREEEEDGVSTELSSDVEGFSAAEADEAADVWTAKEVISETRPPKDQNLSWDALRATFPKKPSPTPFLSEQSNDVFDAARHHVLPRLNDPSLQLRYVLPTELMDHLLINLVGNSSLLYIWDPNDERFVSYEARGNAKVLVIIEGLDDVASNSVIQRFLNIGSLLRRLELLVTALRRRHSSPTTHAFSHALSTILIHIRTSLSHGSPHPATHTTSLWLHYAETESVLSALATLCHRNNSPPYDQLPKSPAGLLSHVYECLEKHIELGSSQTITALIAYILTMTSRDYFDTLGESLGLLEPSRPRWLRAGPQFKSREPRCADDILPLDDAESINGSVSSTSNNPEHHDMPSFVPTELVEALPAARKSLRILQAADPDHPLCSSSIVETCRWVWTADEVERLWECRKEQSRPEGTVENVPGADLPAIVSSAPSKDYQHELAQFQIFDLEPGTHLENITPLVPSSTPSLEPFLNSFPNCLPPITPKLRHLARVVLQPLFTRTAVLSRALLKLYLTSLQLETHLVFLRSYMLFTLPSFRRRLVDALFSDTDEIKHMGRGVRAQTRARLGIQDSRDLVDDDDEGAAAAGTTGIGHGIGLERGLAAPDTWPPGGADLSFFLRTVIVDSLEERRDPCGDDNVENVWREGEFRLGFALRDLPIGDGMERWLNPMSIEALDFLYLDYRPPHRLDVVITPFILSKYQRIFTFLLRLFRASTVSRILYRTTFKSTSPVFSYAPSAQKLLLSLRLQIQGFVTGFMTYIFDSVIGGNFDAYLRWISELRSAVAGGDNDNDDGFADHSEHEFTSVFTLRDTHSELLDRILRGCLLRTSQRSAGDPLREILELILRFGVLVMSLRRGAIREAAAAEELSEVYGLFQSQMLLFIKTVQAMHVKDQARDNTAFPGLPGQLHAEEEANQRPGQYSQMGDLVTRIDPTGWWRRKVEKQTKRAV